MDTRERAASNSRPAERKPAPLAVLTPADAWCQRRQALQRYVGKDLTISNADGAERAANVIRDISSLLEDLKNQRLAVTRPIDACKREIMEQEKRYADGMPALKDAIQASLTAWHKQERAKRIAAREAQQEATMAVLRAVPVDAPAEEIAAAVEAVESVAVAETEPAKQQGVAMRSYACYRVVDRGQIPVGFLAADPCDSALVKRFILEAAKQGQPTEIPGLETWIEERPVVRR